jgi:hypothetical protein
MKAKQTEATRENASLRAHLKATQTDLRKKDDMIKRLANELKSSGPDIISGGQHGFQSSNPWAHGYMAPEEIAMAAFHPPGKGRQNE